MSFRAMDIAASGLTTQSDAMGVISNNIANLQTTGFKSSRAAFQDLMYTNLGGISLGSGVGLAATQLNFTQGPLQQTGQPLDMAISGNGFFRVTDAQGGSFYTRAGNFSQDGEGNLVLQSGSQSLRLQPPVQIPSGANNINITSEGAVTGTIDGKSVTFGQIEGASFPNPEGLYQVGDNLFAESGASGDPVPGQFGSGMLGSLTGGYLERSNVDFSTQIMDLIQTQQAFSASSVVFETANNVLKQAQQLNK